MGTNELKWHNMYSKESLILNPDIEYILAQKKVNLLDMEKEYIKTLSEYDREALLDNIIFFDFLYVTRDKKENGGIREQILLTLLAFKEQLERNNNLCFPLEEVIKIPKQKIYSIMLEESIKYTSLWKLYKLDVIGYNELLKNFIESIEKTHEQKTDYNIFKRIQ